MSDKFEMVKFFYDSGAWNIDKVANAVVRGWITSTEYKQITGKIYKAGGKN